MRSTTKGRRAAARVDLQAMHSLTRPNAVMSSMMSSSMTCKCTSRDLAESSYRWSSKGCRWPLSWPKSSSCLAWEALLIYSTWRQCSGRLSCRRRCLCSSLNKVRRCTFQTSWVAITTLRDSGITTLLFKLWTIFLILITRFITLWRLSST